MCTHPLRGVVRGEGEQLANVNLHLLSSAGCPTRIGLTFVLLGRTNYGGWDASSYSAAWPKRIPRLDSKRLLQKHATF
ncbi:hypothetical protein MRX96_051182 [Rhipicephalus microplus]